LRFATGAAATATPALRVRDADVDLSLHSLFLRLTAKELRR